MQDYKEFLVEESDEALAKHFCWAKSVNYEFDKLMDTNKYEQLVDYFEQTCEEINA